MKLHHITWRTMKLYEVISAICIVVALALKLVLEEKRNQVSDKGQIPR
jgi:hypothetical protein